MMLTHHLLRYLIHYLHLPAWPQFHLIEPHHDAPAASCRLDMAVAQYLRSSEKHPLFDEPVVIWMCRRKDSTTCQ